MSHIRSDGHPLKQLDFKGEIRDLALYADLLPPGIAFTAPRDGVTLNTDTPALEIQYQDSGSGLDLETLGVQVNAVVWPVTCRYGDTRASCTPTTGLPEGVVTLTATIADFQGNTSEAAEIQITIDTTPPIITLTSPPNGSSTNQALHSFVGSLSESALLTLNGEEVRVESTLRFSHGPVSLQEGLNVFELVATDAAMHSRRLDVRLTLDTVPPVAVDTVMVKVDDAAEGRVA